MDHFQFMEFYHRPYFSNPGCLVGLPLLMCDIPSHSNPLCICTSNGVDDKPKALFHFNADVDIGLYVPHAPLSNAGNLQQPYKGQLDKGDFW